MLFDADGHFHPRDAFDAMTGEYRHLRPKLVTTPVGTTLFFEEKIHPRVAHSFPEDTTCDLELRIKDLERLHIDMQLLFPNQSGIFNGLEPKAAAALCQVHNDGMAKAETYGKFISTAMLPLQDADAAIEELHRVVKAHGMRTIVMCPNVNGDNIDRLDLWDLYAEIERLGVVIMFHADSDSPLAGYERMGKHRLINCLGFPFDYLMAIACLIFSGVLDRFPNLKLGFAEGGVSFLPFIEDRLEDTLEAFKSPLAWQNFDIRSRPCNKERPFEYLKRIYHVIGLDESILRFVLERYGVDKFMIGTDFPHPDAHLQVTKHLDELQSITPDTIERLTWKNAQELFGLPASVDNGRPAAAAAKR